MKNYLTSHLSFFMRFGLAVFGVVSFTVRAADLRPNILLVVADDLGYSDLGCYGGEINTPNLDALAESGLRFSRFYTSPLCAPTRAMLLSGNDNHIAGMGNMLSAPKEDFGYEKRLTRRIATAPQVLRMAGYHTYIAGKWHLGISPEANPHEKGFEHSFVMLGGAGNHYNDQGLFETMPTSLYTKDGKGVKWKEGDYSTDFYTDQLIENIKQHRTDGRPFFAFAAYTSPHWPLQIDAAYWTKYQGQYDDGYEALKERRMERLKEIGMIPHEAVLPTPHPSVAPWDPLTAAQKKIEARKMELYAGMVDNLDFNIGRLIAYLKSVDEFDNTLIVFMSDNGAAPSDLYYHDVDGPFIREHFNYEYDRMGDRDSFVSYGPGWAEAGSAPFRHFKFLTTEGGMVAPMIISGPGVSRRNEICHGLTTVMDLAPTFYQYARTEYPKTYNDRPVQPLRGASLSPVLSKLSDVVHPPNHVFGLEHNGNIMIRKGDWKLVNIVNGDLLAEVRRASPKHFRLYNLSHDLAEQNDLKETHPKKFMEMIEEWERFSSEIRVLP